MWFKQIQIFQLNSSISYSADQFAAQLEPFMFTPCLPSFPTSIGWVSPLDLEEAPLVHALNGYMMFCLQMEEKILPSTVIKQALKEKIKKIQDNEDRKIYKKEKLTLQDEVVINLLPRAFSKFNRVYAYIDTRNNWLILNTTHAKKTEQFVSLFKKSTNVDLSTLKMNKLAPLMTHWLLEDDVLRHFMIEKSCVLQDPNQQKRQIRCQEQNLFAEGIQTIIKDGCYAKQLALNWQERVSFTLTEDFMLNSVQFHDDVIAQTKEMAEGDQKQQFDADLVIMTETLALLFKDLLELLTSYQVKDPKEAEAALVA